MLLDVGGLSQKYSKKDIIKRRMFMNLITIKDIYKNRDAYLNQEIQVGGWIRSLRDSKAFGFIVLNDRCV